MQLYRRSLRGALLGILGLAPAAQGVTADWTTVGNPGNVADFNGRGSVAYVYRIGTYEVTNSQYAEFLNATAASDPLALYNTKMSSSAGGIVRTGVSGDFAYEVIPVRADMPVNYVSFYDALRFANWLNNGQGSGDTETGAYTLLGGTPAPSNGTTVTRNPGATVALPSDDEWYKAAYYDASTTVYFVYPTGSNSETTCTYPTAAANTANCAAAVRDLTDVGSYPGSPSPYGTFDQGGNVYEWDERIGAGGQSRTIRGAGYIGEVYELEKYTLTEGGPLAEAEVFGFRVVNLPEPGASLLPMVVLLSALGRRVRRE